MTSPASSKVRGTREQEGPESEAHLDGLRHLEENTDRYLMRKGEVRLW